MTTREVFRFWVARPPAQLRANAAGYSWGGKNRLGREYGDQEGLAILAQVSAAALQLGPFKQGRLSSVHYFSRQVADADNCVADLKPVIDLLKVANKGTGKRYRLGIINDDRHLEIAAPKRVGNDHEHAGRIHILLEVWT